MKISTAKRRINKVLDELTQTWVDSFYAQFKDGYIKGYADARQGVSPMYAEAYAIADTPQTDKDKVVCPNCGRSDFIRSFEKDFGIKNSEYRYKCINCNTYIKDTPQTDRDAYWKELFEAVVKGEMSDAEANQAWYEYINKQDTPQTDCGWK